MLQFTAPFMNLEILVNEKFSDLSFEYMLYLTLACTSILFGWWALTQLGRFADVEAIMQSANQAATRISLPMIKYLEEKLKDVKTLIEKYGEADLLRMVRLISHLRWASLCLSAAWRSDLEPHRPGGASMAT